MKELKLSTKAGQRYYNAYLKSEIYDIYQAYKSPSYAKECAFNNICNRDNVRGIVYIIGHNCSTFTTAYKSIVNNRSALIIDTAHNTYYIYLD